MPGRLPGLSYKLSSFGLGKGSICLSIAPGLGSARRPPGAERYSLDPYNRKMVRPVTLCASEKVIMLMSIVAVGALAEIHLEECVSYTFWRICLQSRMGACLGRSASSAPPGPPGGGGGGVITSKAHRPMCHQPYVSMKTFSQ